MSSLPTRSGTKGQHVGTEGEEEGDHDDLGPSADDDGCQRDDHERNTQVTAVLRQVAHEMIQDRGGTAGAMSWFEVGSTALKRSD